MPDPSSEEQEEISAIGLFNFGLAYLETGRAVTQSRRKITFRDPHEFLFSHGLELILKADLRRSLPMRVIKRDFGHNLNKLLAGVSTDFTNYYRLDDGFRVVVGYLAEGHSSAPYRSRYIQTGVRQMIDIADIELTMFRFHDRNRVFLKDFYVTANNVP